MNEQKNCIQEQMTQVSKSSRLVSAFVDYLPMMCISIIANAIAMKMFQNEFDMNSYMGSTAHMSEEESLMLMRQMFSGLSVMLLPLSIACGIGYTYFLCKDFFGGRSIGKRLHKYQLIRLDGGQVSYLRMVVRNLFLVIWPVEFILYMANSGQRLGDILCKTTVVPATEENKQPIDIQKLITAIALVAVFCTAISYLYYQGLMIFFSWYSLFIENMILRM